jgi:hypothetical protein
MVRYGIIKRVNISIKLSRTVTQRQYCGKRIYTRTLAITEGTSATQCPRNLPPLQSDN